MDLNVSQEKWIRHWSKACPACSLDPSQSVTVNHCRTSASSTVFSTAVLRPLLYLLVIWILYVVMNDPVYLSDCYGTIIFI